MSSFPSPGATENARGVETAAAHLDMSAFLITALRSDILSDV